jgi:hypothetical protein
MMPGSYDICPICGWEDDELGLRYPNERSPANKMLIGDARANFRNFGAAYESDLAYVRKPKPDEISKFRWFWLFWMTYFPKSYFRFRVLQYKITHKNP